MTIRVLLLAHGFALPNSMAAIAVGGADDHRHTGILD
jgi:hypothetical protein